MTDVMKDVDMENTEPRLGWVHWNADRSASTTDWCPPTVAGGPVEAMLQDGYIADRSNPKSLNWGRAGEGRMVVAYRLPGAPNRPERRAEQRAMLLPVDSSARKDIPIVTGMLDYFPLACAYVAQISKAGNEKHNPGQKLHWAKDKSTDHADCIGRHLVDRGTVDPEDGFLHDGKLAWRALANLETVLGNGSPQ